MGKPVKFRNLFEQTVVEAMDTHGGWGFLTTPDQIRFLVHGVATLSWVINENVTINEILLVLPE